jgi:hypothetical protein
LDVEKGYFTDLSPEMIVQKYMNLISARRDWSNTRLDIKLIIKFLLTIMVKEHNQIT